MKIDKIVWYLAAMVILFAVIKQCEKEPKIITKTETKTIVVKDTITETVIKEVPKTVYVEKIINQKGDTEIVFVKDSTSTSIKAKQYDTTLKSTRLLAQRPLIENQLQQNFWCVGNVAKKLFRNIVNYVKLKEKEMLRR